MIGQFWTVLSGLAVLVSAIAMTLWQILSAPDRPNYPTSGRLKRTAMFIVAAAFSVRATEILFGAFAPTPLLMTPTQAISACSLATLFVIFLVDHLRRWLPAHTWRRIQQLLSIARCRPRPEIVAARTSAMRSSTGEPCRSAAVVGPALADLHLDGFRVVAPMEGPEALDP